MDVPSTSQQGTTPLPSPPLAQGPPTAEGHQEAVLLRKVIKGLRNHIPKLYRQLRVGTQFDPDVVKIILNTVDKASGGMPWPVGLALQAVLFIADNALQVHDNATVGDSLASTIEELQQKLRRIQEGLRVPDEHQDELKKVALKLIAASAVVDDIVGRQSRRTCGIFFCAQCNAMDLSDVRADLEECLGSIRDVIIFIAADRLERPCDKAPELPSHLVRMDDRVSEVIGFLRDSRGSTRVLGLHGQGGIGKTTLMRAVEANLRSQSQADNDRRTTHEIASVEVGAQPLSLKDLQKSLYTQLSGGSNESFSSDAQGRAALKDLMKKLKDKGKKICIFLDNVWELEHLTDLLPQDGLPDALPNGSYLVISSRSAHVAAKLGRMCFKTREEEVMGYLGYQVPLLPKQDAEDLFLQNASREEEAKPLQRDDPLVQAIVPRCDGLPLALTVYGSYFKDGERRKPNEWKKVLEQLERAEDPLRAEHRVFQKLKASVDVQVKGLQDAFLDAALLSRFVSSSEDSNDDNFGSTKKALELVTEDLDDLVDQSLVTWSGGRVKIHDLLLNVAKQMAKERNVWSVTNDASEDEIAEFLRPPRQVPSIKVFDERAWCQHAKQSYPSSDQMQDVMYLRLNARQGHPLVNQRREFVLMITKHCHNLRMLEVQVEDTLEDTLVVQEQLSWISSLRQLRWLSVEGDSFAGISKADMRNLFLCPMQRHGSL